MYDRAARMLTRPVTNTAPTVGPGTYYSPTTPPAGTSLGGRQTYFFLGGGGGGGDLFEATYRKTWD